MTEKKEGKFRFIMDKVINMEAMLCVGKYILIMVLCLIAIERMVEWYLTTGVNLSIIVSGGLEAKIFITSFMGAIVSIPLYVSYRLINEIFGEETK